jgi:outer membrane immunogenic protein|nr:outer membrane beta-barrel protein [Pseudomonas sp.]
MAIRSLLLGASIAVVASVGAQAADLIIPTTPEPIYEAAGFSWDGLYAGIEAGGIFADGDDTTGLVGGIVGVNFTVADPIVVGIEVQADYLFLDGDDAGLVLALGRVGALLTDSVLIYAAGGLGTTINGDDDVGVFALGAGVEVALTDSVSLRGEVLGLGNLDDDDDIDGDDDFFAAGKATVGVFYHF